MHKMQSLGTTWSFNWMGSSIWKLMTQSNAPMVQLNH